MMRMRYHLLGCGGGLLLGGLLALASLALGAALLTLAAERRASLLGAMINVAFTAGATRLCP